MKKLIAILAMAIMLMASTAWAVTNVSFQWDANTEPDLAGYKIYRSQTSGVYDLANPVMTIPCTVNDTSCTQTTEMEVPDGIWYWVATAYDSEGNESGFSNELTRTFDTQAPNSPGSFTITVTVRVDVTP